jgi:hypothetical protein
MTDKTHNSRKRPPVVLSHNVCYATKRPSTPPGTMRLSFCPECGRNYYGSEKAHRHAFHGEPIT